MEPRYTCLDCGRRMRGWASFKAHRAWCRLIERERG